jgi:hypothetical protein
MTFGGLNSSQNDNESAAKKKEIARKQNGTRNTKRCVDYHVINNQEEQHTITLGQENKQVLT